MATTVTEMNNNAQSTHSTLTVYPTRQRNFNKEYIAQLNEDVLSNTFPETSENGFLLIRSTHPFETEIHAKLKINNGIPADSIGLDFTLRTALGAPSTVELKHGGADSVNTVEVEAIDNAETVLSKRKLNEILGVRPQVCRVRMGVFPDLEDKTCRLSSDTMEMIGVEEGDDITIESTKGDRIVRGIKAHKITEKQKNTKQKQKDRDKERYPNCQEMLELDRIRRTEVDIPEIWIDEEVRTRLGLQELTKCGVCQPVRVYRDTKYLFLQSLHQFAVPLVIVLLAAGIEVQDRFLTVGLWLFAVGLWVSVLLVESHSQL